MERFTLVVMAAGMGARFGGGIKQLEPLGPNGESIMLYSVHDAIRAGFHKIVFIIRRDIEGAFQTLVGKRIEAVCAATGVEVCYTYQTTANISVSNTLFSARRKPWGTCQAVLCAAELLDGPFAVINADDYYGANSFCQLYDWLSKPGGHRADELCMIGFRLDHTLSESGGVTRGICQMDGNGYLAALHETRNIVVKNTSVFADEIPLDGNSCVSMNMWGFPKGFIYTLQEGFVHFLQTDALKSPMEAECLLPVLIDSLLQKGEVSVQVIETAERWFGITYQADKHFVAQAFQQLTECGLYQTDLFSDLRCPARQAESRRNIDGFL